MTPEKIEQLKRIINTNIATLEIVEIFNNALNGNKERSKIELLYYDMKKELDKETPDEGILKGLFEKIEIEANRCLNK